MSEKIEKIGKTILELYTQVEQIKTTHKNIIQNCLHIEKTCDEIAIEIGTNIKNSSSNSCVDSSQIEQENEKILSDVLVKGETKSGKAIIACKNNEYCTIPKKVIISEIKIGEIQEIRYASTNWFTHEWKKAKS